MGLSIAIVGATGAVGQEFLRVLEQRRVAVDRLRAFASARSAGGDVKFRGESTRLETIAPGAFRGTDFVLLSAGASISRSAVPQAIAEGAVAIDNSSAYRDEPSVPLIVPEVNGARIAEHKGVIANPNCTAAILLMALAPLQRRVGVKRVVVASYQAVSGKGAKAMAECESQSRDVLAGKAPRPEVFSKPIAFNVLPHVDVFEADGRTREEIKIERESRKILEHPSLVVDATCVRVPVMRCHSEAVTVELGAPLSPDEARALWRESPGVRVVDDPSHDGYPTPLDAAGGDDVLVGRTRRSQLFTNGLCFWCVGDQLRKGAALNAVQILEQMTSARTAGAR